MQINRGLLKIESDTASVTFHGEVFFSEAIIYHLYQYANPAYTMLEDILVAKMMAVIIFQQPGLNNIWCPSFKQTLTSAGGSISGNILA